MDFNVILKFLKAVSKNNDRDWFDKNKAKYLEAKAIFDEYVAKQLDALIEVDESLAGLDPRKLTFRIYRDVRFSKDKRPYKINFAAAFSSTGKGMGMPGYYLHIEPGKSFVAGGLFHPEADVLSKVRQEIDYNGAALSKIISSKKFQSHFADFWQDDKLKTAPKGYPKEHTYVEWLKLKSFIVKHVLSDAEVTDKKFLKIATAGFKALKPLNDFLTDALHEA